MSKMEEKLRQILTCGVCLEMFKNPKTLACEHSFCKRCLELTFRKNKMSLICPSCRYFQDDVKNLIDISMIQTSLYLKQTMDVLADDNDVVYEETINDGYDVLETETGIRDLTIVDKKNDEKRKKSTTNDPNKDLIYFDDDDDNYEDCIDSDDDEDLKKKTFDVSESESENDDEVRKRRACMMFPKKKKSVFKKLSKHFLGMRYVLDDLNDVEHNGRMLREISNSTQFDNVDGKSSDKCTEAPYTSGTKSKKFCSFCRKFDHDLAHCQKAILAARDAKRKEYARTAAVVGTGYLAATRSGTLGYTTSQGMPGNKGLAPNKKPKQKRKSVPSSKVGCGRGTGRGGLGGHCSRKHARGRGRSVILLT